MLGPVSANTHQEHPHTGRGHGKAAQSPGPGTQGGTFLMRGGCAAPPLVKSILDSSWKGDCGYFDQTFPVSGVMQRLVPEFKSFMTEFRPQTQKAVYGTVRIPQ